MSKERYHLGLAEALARACEAVTNADSTQPLLAQPGELAVGRAEGAPDDHLRTFDDPKSNSTFAWLRRARAVMDLLASPEPPEGFYDSFFEAAEKGHPKTTWAWLRRQAGLEGEGR